MKTSTNFDTIIIGSGSGGLTAALALSQAGQKVGVFEQHYLPGGWTQTFALDGSNFDPGVHYVGIAYPKLLAALGLGELEFCRMNPDGFDHLLIGGDRFDIPQGYKQYLDRLTDLFPGERAGIVNYFETMRQLERELLRVDSMLSFPDFLSIPRELPTLTRWGLRTQQALLDKYIRDPFLRDILSAQCGNHGLAPSRVALPLHASMVTHYFDGAFYPLGGSKRIVAAMIRRIRDAGGEIRVKAEVKEILIENGRACGVVLASGERIRAANVISNADPRVTFSKLVPRWHGLRERFQSMRMTSSIGMPSVFCRVEMDLKTLGYDSGNYWWFQEKGGVGAFYEQAEKHEPWKGGVKGLFLAITTLKDPTHARGNFHVIEMFTFAPNNAYARWMGTKQGERGKEYEDLKRKTGDAMIAAAEHIIPGITPHIVFRNDATPCTAEFYCVSPDGGAYGIAKTPLQVGPFSFSVQSSIPGLYNVGASTVSHGQTGTAMSGLMAAGRILRRPVRDLLDRGAPPLRIYPADQVGQRHRTA